MTMLIVEGPDGSGKTTMADRLANYFDLVKAPRLAHSIDGPIRDLHQGVIDRMVEQTTCPPMVYDRFAPISEPIYGSIVREDLREGFYDPAFAHIWRKLVKLNPFILFCLPPYSAVVANLREVEQMDGVMEHLYPVYHMYCSMGYMLQGLLGPKRVVVYDYTLPEPSQATPRYARRDLANALWHIKNHLEEADA